jgi:kynurenine 3-monooxygenase
MNSGFEDTLVFSEILDQEKGDLSAAVLRFASERRPDGDAIAALSSENYKEMRSHTASSLFLVRKKVERVLHALFPSWWVPKYTMVSFTRIPYSEAYARAKRQDNILNILGGLTVVAAVAGAYVFGKDVLPTLPDALKFAKLKLKL